VDEAWQADNPEGLFQMTADDFPEESPVLVMSRNY